MYEIEKKNDPKGGLVPSAPLDSPMERIKKELQTEELFQIFNPGSATDIFHGEVLY